MDKEQSVSVYEFLWADGSWWRPALANNGNDEEALKAIVESNPKPIQVFRLSGGKELIWEQK